MGERDHLTEDLNQTQTSESTLCTMGMSNYRIYSMHHGNVKLQNLLYAPWECQTWEYPVAWRLMLQEFQQHRWKGKEAISCYTVNSLSSAKELDVALPRSPSHIKQSISQQSCKFIVWPWSYLTPKTTFPFLIEKKFLYFTHVFSSPLNFMLALSLSSLFFYFVLLKK